LRHADVGIGQYRLGGLNVVVGEFRRPVSGAANMPRGSKARLGAHRAPNEPIRGLADDPVSRSSNADSRTHW